jgi:hypothetical protein
MEEKRKEEKGREERRNEKRMEEKRFLGSERQYIYEGETLSYPEGFPSTFRQRFV